MKIRIVDYVASLGGGVRFTTEMLGALGQRPGLSFEVVSHGAQLERFRRLVPADLPVRFADIAPRHLWREQTLLAGVPGAGPLNWLLRTPQFHFSVPPRAVDDCDLVWFPWMHRHRIPWSACDRVVASLHDIIIIQFPEMFHPKWSENERATVARWLESQARIAVSADATAQALGRVFGMAADRVTVIPLSAQHREPERLAGSRPWPFLGKNYVLCPANTSRHKNHEILLKAMEGIATEHPLVLTGEGTDLQEAKSPRGIQLRVAAREASLRPGETIFALGYVDEETYDGILDGAWALVMPTLAEGGGSFPVWEAMRRGIPVVTSDIPVMREMVGRVGGEVLWFDPHDHESLARTLADLDMNYDRYRSRAVALTQTLKTRTWADVASDYAGLMGLPASVVGGDANA